MKRIAEHEWEFFLRLWPGNILLADLLKLISKCAEMLSVDIWESARVCAGKIRA